MPPEYGPGFPDPAQIEKDRQKRERDAQKELLDYISDGRPILTQFDPYAEAFIQQMKLRPTNDPLAMRLLSLARRTQHIDGPFIQNVIELTAIRKLLATKTPVRVAVWDSKTYGGIGSGRVDRARYVWRSNTRWPRAMLNIEPEFFSTGYNDGRQQFEAAAAGADARLDF